MICRQGGQVNLISTREFTSYGMTFTDVATMQNNRREAEEGNMLIALFANGGITSKILLRTFRNWTGMKNGPKMDVCL